MSDTGHTGAVFETLALQYLQQQGLSLVSRNFSCRYGEIDLICRKNQMLVFVEVKYRQSNGFGGAAAAVTLKKQQKLAKTASCFLQQQRSQAPCRFDVVAITGEAPYRIEWIQNAF
jgi:putative endonuclease